jgi:DNA-directed RNA polymerase alpha subunit
VGAVLAHIELESRFSIEPLSRELIAKLEIAVAHRNRERAVAVIERHFEAMDEPKEEGLNAPLSSVLPQRVASLLEREGFLYLADFEGMEEAELSAIKGVGPKVIEMVRKTLENAFSSANTEASSER